MVDTSGSLSSGCADGGVSAVRAVDGIVICQAVVIVDSKRCLRKIGFMPYGPVGWPAILTVGSSHDM